MTQRPSPPPTLAAVRAMTAMFYEPGAGGQPPVLKRWAVSPLLALVIAALGINWPLMNLALQEVSPVWFTVYRLGGSALVLAVGLALAGQFVVPPPPDRRLVVGVGFFRLSIVTTMALYALSLVPPGRASILIYTSALWTIPLAAWFLGERLTLPAGIGVTLGLGGLMVLLSPARFDWSDRGTLLGTGLLLAAAVIVAAVAVQTRGHTWTATPLQLMPWQAGLAVVPVIPLAIAVEGLPTFDWQLRTWLIVVFQFTIGTPFTIWGTQTVLRRMPAITTNLALTAVPVIGVISAALVVGETITVTTGVALALITIGVWIGVGIGARRIGEAPITPR